MKTYARMNTFTVLTAVCAMAFATAPVLLFTGCATISPQAVRIYKSASMQTAQPKQAREIMTQEDISALIQRGDSAFSRKDYTEAKELYYTVLLTDPEPDTEVIVSYGACLANLNRYQDAITVFYIALNKDPYNETANKNIAICRENIAAQEKRQQAEYERQQREQEERERQNWENTMAILNALSQAASAYSGAYSSGSSDYSGGGSSGGQSVSSGGSSSGGRGGNANEASMRNNYNTRAKAAEDVYFQLQRAQTAAEVDRLGDALRSHQRDLRAYREECKRRGVDIQASMYETAWPR